jgi:argininosuccinate lyase
MKLWTGRLSGSMDTLAARLNNSLPFDQRLAQVDVRGSMAWARALARAGVISEEEAGLILQGLETTLEEFNQAAFVYQDSDEDIHTAVERRLTEMVGPVGGKLHTGRSRNDQVLLDLRLYGKERLHALAERALAMIRALAAFAKQHELVPMPGRTHMQIAMPSSLGLWAGEWA